MKPLLAKSYNKTKYPNYPPDYALLTQHSRDVAQACSTLADIVGKIGLDALGLNEEVFENFKLELKANGWLQDVGKANSHFQEMVEGKLDGTQLLRHETISGLLAYKEDLPLRKWLSQKFSEKSLLTIIWAAMGHHRKFDKETQPKETSQTLAVDTLHSDFKQILSEMGKDLEIKNIPYFENKVLIAEESDDENIIDSQIEIIKLQKTFKRCEKVFEEEKDRRYLALIKALGIAADVSASAVAKKEKFAKRYSLAVFIKDSFEIGLKLSDFSEITDKHKPYPFQEKVADSKAYLTFAQAGCGSGKSLAAYLWARNRCKQFSDEGKTNFRLFFCLPTTGTTTEHFKDYALESGVPPEMLKLSHSRSSVDLQTIAKTAPQEEASENSKDIAQEMLRNEQDKIESLALWTTPLVVTTSDTVLGLMANARKSVYSLPSILCSAIVFDEIHAFDDQMFGHLIVFVKNFPKLPILLMTASLPEKRLEAIKKVRPDFTDEHCINGDKDFAEIERYSINEVQDYDQILDAIEKCVSNNGKVLWVRNQVDWANAAYLNCSNRFTKDFPQLKIDIYHSRLKYKHRSKRHRKVIDDFKNEGFPAILIATQVAEMSLDLSADLLITDIAPIPALIQRLGRLNRRLKPTTPENERKIKPALVYLLPDDETNSKPYEIDDLKKAGEWIAELQKEYGNSLSQQHLADCFGKFSIEKDFDIETAEEKAVFFSGLWQTRPGVTRGEGYTINVILEEDYENWKQTKGTRQPDKDWFRENEVAIPIKNKVFGWEIFGGLRVAKSEDVEYDYNPITDKGTGAKW